MSFRPLEGAACAEAAHPPGTRIGASLWTEEVRSLDGESISITRGSVFCIRNLLVTVSVVRAEPPP
ncbi:unnamed protein product [Amoebophrya sp. A120]|nr:unnamed protein product [Amoebophrya sp. A120]|eukprot:GSA120T00014973001.1